MARQQAVNESGAYIQGTMRLENGELFETIQLLQANYVSLKAEQSSLEITPDAPNGRLTFGAIAEIDESAMQARIDAMNRDRNLAVQVKTLLVENERLRDRLSTLAQAARGGEGLDRKRLLLKSQLSENRQVLHSMFAQGSLLDMKKRASADLQVRNQSLYRETVEPLLQGGATAEIEKVVGGDSHTTAKVRFSYDPAPDEILKTLLTAFERPSVGPLYQMYRDRDLVWNDFKIQSALRHGRLTNMYALEQMKYLERYLVAIEISLGETKRYVPVFGHNHKQFNSPECYRKDGYSLEELQASGWVQRAGRHIDRNLCLINSKHDQKGRFEITMTNAEAENVRSLQARRVLIDIDHINQM
ncbi:hypothetical protein [Hydrocarboniclastica marina]|nr:hypothetical protein [Hydrocarboniclastica marina]